MSKYAAFAKNKDQSDEKNPEGSDGLTGLIGQKVWKVSHQQNTGSTQE